MNVKAHTPATFLGLLLAKIRQAPEILWRLEARLKGVTLQGKTTFHGRPILSVSKGGRMVFGDGVILASAVRANVLGLSQPCVLRALAPGSQLVLGAQVGLSGTVLVAAQSIEIGERTIIGAGAMVIDNDFHAPVGEWDWNHDCVGTARPVKIGRGVFIGARAIILKGVTIGDRAKIGAGAVVAKDVPPYHVAIGNPARVFPSRKSSTLFV